MSEKNIYLPTLMRIARITEEAPSVRTFRLEFVDEAAAAAFDYRTGQFGLYSAFGEGESTFCIASSPTRKGYIECTFREVGRVTAGLADKEVGDVVGFRGPYGNVFPIEDWKGRNLLFIAGGIALPPLRSVIWNCLDLRDWFKDITIVYGARTVADLVYKHELKEWAGAAGREPAVHRGPRRRDAGLDRQGGLRPAHRRAGRPQPRKHRRAGVRAAHHDQADPAGAARSWASPRRASTPPWRTA